MNVAYTNIYIAPIR